MLKKKIKAEKQKLKLKKKVKYINISKLGTAQS